jgi:hypothetical protein
MSKSILPTAYGQAAIGTKTVRIGYDATVNPVSTTTKLSLGFLPANAVLKAARATVLTVDTGNLLLISTTDGGTTNTTRLTVDTAGAVGTRTSAPTNVDATGAAGNGAILDTGTTALELMLMGSAALDTAQVVFDLEVYFGPTTGADGTGVLSL